MAENPKYWSDKWLRVSELNVKEVMESRVVQLVSGIQFARHQKAVEVLGQLFDALSADKLPRLKIIIGLDLGFTYLTDAQVTDIFTVMANCKSLPLYDLDISGNDLTSVPAEDLGRAVSRIKKFDMSEASLTPSQITQIFTVIAEGESNLEELEAPYYNLTNLPGGILVKAIAMLKSVNLCGGERNQDDAYDIYEYIHEYVDMRPPKLRYLCLDDDNVLEW